MLLMNESVLNFEERKHNLGLTNFKLPIVDDFRYDY